VPANNRFLSVFTTVSTLPSSKASPLSASTEPSALVQAATHTRPAPRIKTAAEYILRCAKVGGIAGATRKRGFEEVVIHVPEVDSTVSRPNWLSAQLMVAARPSVRAFCIGDSRRNGRGGSDVSIWTPFLRLLGENSARLSAISASDVFFSGLPFSKYRCISLLSSI